MIKETFYLSDDKTVRLDCYLYEIYEAMPYRATRPAVVVCPGGGYTNCSCREADPIALGYFAAGFNSFVLYYSLKEKADYPRPLTDLSAAMKLIRENAEKWGIIKDQIAVCGFSAGGHLAASLGVHWNDDYIKDKTNCMGGENKPDALILGYPVISTSYMENVGALERIVGNNDKEWAYKQLNLHTCVNSDTPPTFLFHTFRDQSVPIGDSLKFATALEANDIPFEMHIYPNGVHGLSLSNPDVCEDGGDESAAGWFKMSIDWLKRLFYNSEEAKAPVNRAKYSSKL